MRLQSISSMLLADKVVLVMIVLIICNHRLHMSITYKSTLSLTLGSDAL
jgi:hypothetical protein